MTTSCTAYALFGYEAILATDPYQSRDNYVFPLTAIAICFFVAEFILTCRSLGNKYTWGFAFWLDLACIITLIMVIPFVAENYSSLFGVGITRTAR